MAWKTARIALALLVLLTGVAVGTIGSFEHRQTASLLGVRWPTGLLLSLGGVIGLIALVEGLFDCGPVNRRRAVPSRLNAAACAATGWLIALLWLTYLGPPPSFRQKGDIILVNDWRSIGFLLGGMALVTIGVYRAWLASLTARIEQSASGTPGSPRPKA